MSITEPVTKRTQTFNNRRTTAKYLLEYLLGMLTRCNIQRIRSETIKFRKIGIVVIVNTEIIKNVFAYGFKQCPRRCNRSLRIG